jgi:hypothetical protein
VARRKRQEGLAFFHNPFHALTEATKMSKEIQRCEESSTQKEFFDGIPIRIVTYNGKSYIPIIDIATGIGYDRRNLSRLIESHEDMFEGNREYLPLKTPGGMQKTLCVNRDGIIAMFMGLKINMVQDERKKGLILSFRKWALDVLSKVMDNRIDQVTPFVSQQNPAVPKEVLVGNLFNDHLQIADSLAKFANVDRGIAVNAAIALVEYKTGVDLTAYKGLVQKERKCDDVGLLNATDIGRELGGINAATINVILKKLGYLTWVHNAWALTERGKRYAEVFPVFGFTDSGKSYARYQIKWQPKIVEILHRHMFEEYPDPKDGIIQGFL